jgi:hypothetical protein
LPIASALAFVKSQLDGLAMPGGAPAMAAYIDAPDPNVETQIPTAYVWPTDFDEKRDLRGGGGTVPRNLGPNSPGAGHKTIAHSVDVFIVHMEADDEDSADSLFPGIVDAVMFQLRTLTPMPALVQDPWTGLQTQLTDVGETMRGQIIVGALEDEAYLRYDCRLRLSFTEEMIA